MGSPLLNARTILPIQDVDPACRVNGLGFLVEDPTSSRNRQNE